MIYNTSTIQKILSILAPKGVEKIHLFWIVE